jgi:hypothetical protein
MGTAVVSVDAFITKPPFAFIAEVARPKASIGKGMTSVAELSFLQSCSRIRCRYHSATAGCILGCILFDRLTRRRQVSPAHKNMWQLNELTASTAWLRVFELEVRRFPKSKPMIAATRCPVTR